jgi:hypothetical protein
MVRARYRVESGSVSRLWLCKLNRGADCLGLEPLATTQLRPVRDAGAIEDWAVALCQQEGVTIGVSGLPEPYGRKPISATKVTIFIRLVRFISKIRIQESEFRENATGFCLPLPVFCLLYSDLLSAHFRVAKDVPDNQPVDLRFRRYR